MAALSGLSSYEAVLNVLASARKSLGPLLSAFEVMWPGYYDFVLQRLPELRAPLEGKHAYYVLLESSGADPERQAAAFEDFLADNDVLILKFYLHISHEEQTRRLQARIDNKKKHWKLSDADLKERRFWPDYIDAYNDILSSTSRKHAPWFVIPSDHKWYRNIAISSVIVDLMQGLKLKFPQPTLDVSKIKL